MTGRQRFGLVRLSRRKTIFGYAENQVRIGREAAPNLALARPADAGEIAIGIEQIGDDLEVQVRRPSAVFDGRTEAGDLFAFRYGAAYAQTFQRLRDKVAVGRAARAAPRRPVSQDDHVAVIERRGVVCERIYLAFDRREDRRARFGKKIDAQMNRASLAGQSAAGLEQRRGVKQPGLVIPPDANPDACLGHRAEDAFGQFRLCVLALVAADQGAADAQIQDETRRAAQVVAQNRGEGTRVGAQPFDYGLGVRRRRQFTSAAKDRFCKSRVDLREPWQRFANRLLADVEVIVIGPLPSLARADAGAHTQPKAREAEKRGYLVFGERVFGVIAFDDFSRGGQWVRLVQNGVSDRDGEISHGETVDHVAEIDQTDDALADDALADDALADDALADDALPDDALAGDAPILRTKIVAGGAHDHVVIIRV